MKWNKRFLAVAAALTMAFTAVGCGGGNGGGGGSDTSEVEALLTKAQETMDGVDSMATEMSMEISMAMGEESMDMVTKANILTTADPMKMQMDMTMEVGGDASQTQEMQMFAEEKDGQFVTYMNVAGAWYAQNVSADDLSQYNAEGNMDLYLNNISNFSKTGEESINGTTASKIEGVITGDAMKEAVEDSGVLSSVESMGLSAEDIEAIYSNDLPLTMWIDADGYVVKYELDMTAMMQGIMDQAMASAGLTEEDGAITISKTFVSMTCKDFNAVEVTIPAEAANAQVIG